ncbi:MAG: type II toxin-antitoxin system PemK/MazF family toxin [Methanoregula sp.]|nr:type II toxin-antitoxin system PemK/MazF family toxin [Methanoregula sp.]
MTTKTRMMHGNHIQNEGWQMNDLPQGSIVLVDFTYADQKQSKLRPALVISNSGNNRMSRDVIVMKITSKEPKHWGVSLVNEDLGSGVLDYASFVQVDAIYSLEKTIIRDVIGMIRMEKWRK